jgi:hypothetical protein
MLKTLKDLDLLLHSLDRVLISLQEFLAKQLECDYLARVVKVLGHVDLGCIAFAE